MFFSSSSVSFSIDFPVLNLLLSSKLFAKFIFSLRILSCGEKILNSLLLFSIVWTCKSKALTLNFSLNFENPGFGVLTSKSISSMLGIRFLSAEIVKIECFFLFKGPWRSFSFFSIFFFISPKNNQGWFIASFAVSLALGSDFNSRLMKSLAKGETLFQALSGKEKLPARTSSRTSEI